MFWQLWPKYEHPNLICSNFISFFVSILCLKQVFDIKKLFFLKTKTTTEQNNFPMTGNTLHVKYLCSVSANFILCRGKKYALHLCAGCDCEWNFGPKSWLFFAFNYQMKLIFGYLQVNSINNCHKDCFVEPPNSSNTQKLFGLHGFLFATWMDVTVNGNGKVIFFSKL